MGVLPSVSSTATNKNLHQALSTFYINAAVLANEHATAAALRDLLLTVILQQLSNQHMDDDSAHRLLLALGTLLVGQQAARELARQSGASALVRFWGARPDERLKAVSGEVLRLLK